MSMKAAAVGPIQSTAGAVSVRNEKDKKKSPITPVPTATTPEEVHLEQKKKIFKPKFMASHAKVIKSFNHAPDLDNSVDDHFAKALGKSTWMRLQQGL